MVFRLIKKTILVVDDDAAYVEKVEALLSHHYLTFAAYDGEQALKLISMVKPDLILLDIGMPKMDGLEFFDRITPLNSKPICPVLIVTVRENLREFFSNLPVEGFMTKPLKGIELLDAISTIFDKSHEPVSSIENRFQRILIVDENLETIRILCQSFLDHGHTVTVAKNGKSAIERIVGPEFPDMLLIRQGLPEHPEYTIPYHLRGIQNARDVKTIIYTDEYRNIDLQTEAQIIKVVGESNFLELRDIEHFFDKFYRILTRPK